MLWGLRRTPHINSTLVIIIIIIIINCVREEFAKSAPREWNKNMHQSKLGFRQRGS